MDDSQFDVQNAASKAVTRLCQSLLDKAASSPAPEDNYTPRFNRAQAEMRRKHAEVDADQRTGG